MNEPNEERTMNEERTVEKGRLVGAIMMGEQGLLGR